MNTGHLCQVVRIWSLVLRQGLWRCFMTMVSSLRKNAVIVGRSNIVGKPMAQLLLDKMRR
nr:hypothetical protein [Streptococcus equi]